MTTRCIVPARSTSVCRRINTWTQWATNRMRLSPITEGDEDDFPVVDDIPCHLPYRALSGRACSTSDRPCLRGRRLRTKAATALCAA